MEHRWELFTLGTGWAWFCAGCGEERCDYATDTEAVEAALEHHLAAA